MLFTYKTHNIKFKIMKKLIFIIAIIITANAVSAQLSGLLGYIKEKPAYTFFDNDYLTPILKSVIDHPDTSFMVGKSKVTYQNVMYYLNNKTYSFIKDKKFYMLSYDTCSNCKRSPSVNKPIERGLYLFRLDNDGWTKACYEPVQTDYFSMDSSIFIPNKGQYSIWSAYCYFPWRTAGDLPEDKGQFGVNVKDGSVTISNNGEVTIVLVNHKYYSNNHGKHPNDFSFENKTIVLVPYVSDNKVMYSIAVRPISYSSENKK
jgi:hypothetical protein